MYLATVEDLFSRRMLGSRHSKQRRRRQNLLDKNTNVRVNHQRHIAKSVVTTPEVRRVVLEDTKVSNMTASAEGTKAFPTRGSGSKRGLNRSIAETAPSRQMALIERAAVIHSVSTVRVNPAYTSLTCFVCGAQGHRETQALFWCPECACTPMRTCKPRSTRTKRQPGLYPSVRDVTYGGRDSRHKTLEDALGSFWTPPAPTEASRTNMPERPEWSLRYISPKVNAWRRPSTRQRAQRAQQAPKHHHPLGSVA